MINQYLIIVVVFRAMLIEDGIVFVLGRFSSLPWYFALISGFLISLGVAKIVENAAMRKNKML